MDKRRIEPGPGRESVWDYPRPPALEQRTDHVVVELNGVTIADSRSPIRILETSHPPVYYIAPADVDMSYLRLSDRSSYCEYKGQSLYYDVAVDEHVEANAAWFYPAPTAQYEALTNFVAFYASRMTVCKLNGEIVQSQAGDFYGGWITNAIVGPFKGEPGTYGW